MENFMVYHVFGFVSKIRLKPGCVPSKFSCLTERKSTGSCPEQPYIIVKKPRNHIYKECLNSHAQLHDTLKGKPTKTDIRMYENIDVKCEKDDDFAFQVIKEEVPSENDFEKGNIKTINKQAEKEKEGHKEVLGCISNVDTLVNEKFAIAVKAQNYTFQLEPIPLRNVYGKILNSEGFNYLSSDERSYDGSFSEEGKREIKNEAEYESEDSNEVTDYISTIDIYEHEVLASTMNSGDDNFELDTKPTIDDLSNTLTGQEINNCRDELTNVNNEHDNTLHLDKKPEIIGDVYDTGQELNDLASGDKLSNSMNRESEKAFKTRIITENSQDDVSGIDTKPVIIHDVHYAGQELNDLSRGDELSNPNITKSGNASKIHTNEPKRASINDNNTNNSSTETEEFEKKEKTLFECNFCQYQCTVKSYLVRHIRKHMGEKPFSCKLCKANFAWSGDLAKHVRVHSKVKPYSCNVCTYKTVDKQTLTKHLRIHTGERPYTCNLCNYAFKQRCALVAHMRTHTKEKPYLCNICDYRAVQKKHLNTHMMRHTGKKPFICDICMYNCSYKSVLNDHMKTHTTDRPHSCKICNYTCKIKSSLVVHERIHTGEKPFACMLCDYECARSSSLNYHIIRRH